MQYDVELSELAMEQYDKFLYYIYYTLKNPQAANSLMQDNKQTIPKMCFIVGIVCFFLQ